MESRNLAVIVIVVLVALFVLAFNPFKPVPSDSDLPPEVPEDQFDENGTLTQTDATPITTYSNLAECSGLLATERENCITQIAVQESDESLCGSLGEDDVDWCRKEVIVAKGVESACEALENPQKNQCFFDFGYGNNSIESCRKIQENSISQDWRDDCLRFVAQHLVQEEACGFILNPDVKDDCILNVAVEGNRIELCSQIVDQETRIDCTDSFEPDIESSN